MPTVKSYQKQREKEKIAYDYFISQGYSPEATAGIVGNLVYESGLNTSAEGDIGYRGGSSFGIAQFRGKRLQDLKKRYGDKWTDFGNQLDFVRHELETTHQKANLGLKNATTAYQAGQVFSDLYEIPAKKYKNNPERQKKVNKIYSSFSGMASTPISDRVIAETNSYFDNLPTTTVKDFDISADNTNLAEEIKEEQPDKKDEDIEEVKKQTNEYNFLKDYQNLINQPISQQPIPQEQPIVQTEVPDLTGIYNQVSNFIDTQIAQQGGVIKDNIPNLEPDIIKDKNIDPKAYLESYLNSPVYLERLRQQGYENPQEVVKYRLNKLKTVKEYIQNPNDNYFQELYREFQGFPDANKGSRYSPSDNKLTLNPTIDKQRIKPNPSTEAVRAHELSHALQSGVNLNYKDNLELFGRQRQFQLDDDFRKQDLEGIVKNKVYNKMDHDFQPIENKADIDALRYLMYKNGIYDTRTDGKFNQGHLNKLKNSEFIKSRLQKNYTDDDIIWLMNNIADSSKTYNNYAQQGGTIGNLTPDQTLEVENQRKWLNNWNQNRVVDGVKINTGTQIPFSSDIYVDDLNYGKNEGETTLGEYDRVSDRLLLDNNFQNKQGIPVHEFSHRFQKYVDPSTYNKYIKEPFSQELQNIQGLNNYRGDIDENQAELNRLRYNYQLKPDQVITPQDVETYNLEDYNLKHFSKDQLLNLLNKTAYNSTDSNTYAQEGKKITINKDRDQWINLGEITPSELAFLKEVKSSTIKNNQGQRLFPNKITEIQGNVMSTEGYGNIDLYVVPDKGEPKIIKANTGQYTFPNATKFTEYPLS